jgi:hypothetical protein
MQSCKGTFEWIPQKSMFDRVLPEIVNNFHVHTLKRYAEWAGEIIENLRRDVDDIDCHVHPGDGFYEENLLQRYAQLHSTNDVKHFVEGVMKRKPLTSHLPRGFRFRSSVRPPRSDVLT